jgi:hypothetical protein
MLKSDELIDPRSCLNRAMSDEMLFVLLGRDPAAPRAIRAWINERVVLGKNKISDDQIVEAMRIAEEMEAQHRQAQGAEAQVRG